MRFLHEPYDFSHNERWLLSILVVGFVYVAIVAYVPPSAGQMPVLCPVRCMGGTCPGCGLTRACASLLCLEWASAVQYNPLIIFIAPFGAYRILVIAVGIMTGRVIVSNWPYCFVMTYQYCIVLACFALTAIRVVAWLWPACNPGGYGLPLIE